MVACMSSIILESLENWVHAYTYGAAGARGREWLRLSLARRTLRI